MFDDNGFYDSNYDLNRDGKLDCGEQVLYQKYVLGVEYDDTGGSIFTGRRRNGMSYDQKNNHSVFGYILGILIILFDVFLFGIGLLVVAIFPPVGVLIILLAVKIFESIG